MREMKEMRGISRLVLYVFGAYNMIFGAIAVISPSITAVLYSVPEVTPEWSGAARWVGAFAVAIGYGAFSAVKTGNKEMLKLLVISAYAMMIATIFSVFKGEASIFNVSFDFIIQAALVIALYTTGKKNSRYNF